MHKKLPILIITLCAIGLILYFALKRECPAGATHGISIATLVIKDGFPLVDNETVDLSQTSLTSIDGVDLLPVSITTLRLSRNHLTSNALVYYGFIYTPRLKTLFLDHNALTTIRPEMLAGLKGLEKLYLNNNQIASIEPGAFRHLPNLKKLFLSGNRLKEVPAGAFEGLDNLQELYIYGNELKGTSQEFMETHFPGRQVILGW